MPRSDDTAKRLARLNLMLDQLERCVTLEGGAVSADGDVLVTMRMAAVKSFEVAFELAVLVLADVLATHIAHTGRALAGKGFHSVVVKAHNAGLINSEQEWWDYRRCRNSTVHAYDRHRERQVLRTAPAFVAAARGIAGQAVHAHPSRPGNGTTVALGTG